MTKEDIQTRYDTLLAGILFTVPLLGMCTALLGDLSPLFDALQIISGVGMASLLMYVLLATLFLDACVSESSVRANRLHMAAKCFQWVSMLISLAIIILLSII